MKNVSIVIIGLVLLLFLSCSSKEEVSTQAVNSEATLPLSIEGVYVGTEEMCYTDSTGKKGCYNDPSRPEWKWYRLNYVKIKGDSVFMDQSPIMINGTDTLFSASDGGFYYYSGIIDRKGNELNIKLEQLDCDYCAKLIKTKPDGTYEYLKVEKQMKGKISKAGIVLNDVLYKKIIHKENLVSESRKFYLK